MTRIILPIFVDLAVQASGVSCNNLNSFYATPGNDEADSRLSI